MNAPMLAENKGEEFAAYALIVERDIIREGKASKSYLQDFSDKKRCEWKQEIALYRRYEC